MKKFLVALVLLGTSLFATADIVTVPIPGAPGLSVTVGTGVNALPLTDIRSNPNATNITMGDDQVTNIPLGFNFPYFGKTFNNSWMSSNGFVTFQDPYVSGLWDGCCGGVNLTTTTDPRYNYTIFGVHSDLYAAPGVGSNWYLRETSAMTYGWYNVSQCCSNQGGNSFEIKVNSSGLVDTRIAGALVNWNTVTSGMTGDLSQGQYYQFYHGQGWTVNTTTGGVSWGALQGTGVDQCTTDPLSSPSCPNYFTAQCTISPLYNPSCPGYSAAYFTQQCTANQLYDPQCPGYAQAYLDYQCSQDPLYSTTCQGYEQAYFDKQCSANPLYNTNCPGYAEAYFTQQCNLNGLYSTRCPNYATAYATRAVLEQQGTASVVATAGVVAQTAPQTTTTSTSDGSSSVAVAVVSDPVVNQAVTSTATSTSPAAAATATVSLLPPPPAPQAPAAAPEPKKPEGGPSGQQPPPQQSGPQGGEKPQPTARQQLAERRQEAAKKEAVEKGKNLANEMGKAADMEAQKQVQNVVIQAMGFTPGFDAYGKVIVPDVAGYKPFTVYGGQKTVDNRRLGLGLYGPSDRLHSQLVESQYERGN